MHEKRPSLLEEHPSLKATELAKLVGEMWAKLSEDERSVYEQRLQTLDTEASPDTGPVSPPPTTETRGSAADKGESRDSD
jgi:hypothetical protein